MSLLFMFYQFWDVWDFIKLWCNQAGRPSKAGGSNLARSSSKILENYLRYWLNQNSNFRFKNGWFHGGVSVSKSQYDWTCYFIAIISDSFNTFNEPPLFTQFTKISHIQIVYCHVKISEQKKIFKNNIYDLYTIKDF